MTEYNAKIQELEDRLSAAEEELRALKARDNKDDLPEPPHLRPYPECNQIYYHVDDMGEVDESEWRSDRFDLGARGIGNVFVTETAADFAAERLKVLAEMRGWAGKWNDPWEINYTPPMIAPMRVYVDNCSGGELRFATREDAEDCIKAVGKDRLKKYYFGIPEDNGCCTSER